MKQISVESRIIEVANNSIDSKLNLIQYKKEKEKAIKHKAICEAVLAFKAENKYMPMYAILSVGIHSNAFKNDEFDKGYEYFNPKKAQAVFDMAVAYNRAIDKADEAPNDVVYRICNKYYKKVSQNVADFESVVEKAKKKLTDNRNDFQKCCVALGI